jgi:hypothetical protein
MNIDDTSPASKQCAKCGQAKPLSAYYFKKDRNANYRKKAALVPNVALEHDPAAPGVGNDPQERCPPTLESMSKEDIAAVVNVFRMLKRWRDEQLAKGPIPGWKSIDR